MYKLCHFWKGNSILFVWWFSTHLQTRESIDCYMFGAHIICQPTQTKLKYKMQKTSSIKTKWSIKNKGIYIYIFRMKTSVFLYKFIYLNSVYRTRGRERQTHTKEDGELYYRHLSDQIPDLQPVWMLNIFCHCND